MPGSPVRKKLVTTFGLLSVAAVAVLFQSTRTSNQNAAQMQRVRAFNSALKLRGKRALVVGGTSGIGEGVAVRLAQAQASVTIVGRSPERGAAVVQKMQAAAGKASEAQFDFIPCDCFSLLSVEQCAQEVVRRVSAPAADEDAGASTEQAGALDYLVMAQGMATMQGFTPTPEGLDQKLTLHFWSRAAFALQLLPVLQHAEDARVLTVLSAGVHSAYANWSEDPELSGGSYGIKNAADAAGFYNDIMVDSLSREARATSNGQSHVTFMHAAPGFVATRWGTEMPTVVRWLVRALQIFGRSQEDCAEYLVSGLMAPLEDAEKGSFRLLDQYGNATASVTSMHEAAREGIWTHTKAVVEAKHAIQTPKL